MNAIQNESLLVFFSGISNGACKPGGCREAASRGLAAQCCIVLQSLVYTAGVDYIQRCSGNVTPSSQICSCDTSLRPDCLQKLILQRTESRPKRRGCRKKHVHREIKFIMSCRSEWLISSAATYPNANNHNRNSIKPENFQRIYLLTW